VIWFSDLSGHVATFDPDKLLWRPVIDLPALARLPKGNDETYSLSAIFEDKHRVMMFGTNAGLIALNQAHDVCEVFDEKNSPLPDHHVTQIVEDPRGAIWITLCGGIVELEP